MTTIKQQQQQIEAEKGTIKQLLGNEDKGIYHWESAAKPDDLSSSSRNHMIQRENHLLLTSSLAL